MSQLNFYQHNVTYKKNQTNEQKTSTPSDFLDLRQKLGKMMLWAILNFLVWVATSLDNGHNTSGYLSWWVQPISLRPYFWLHPTCKLCDYTLGFPYRFFFSGENSLILVSNFFNSYTSYGKSVSWDLTNTLVSSLFSYLNPNTDAGDQGIEAFFDNNSISYSNFNISLFTWWIELN